MSGMRAYFSASHIVQVIIPVLSIENDFSSLDYVASKYFYSFLISVSLPSSLPLLHTPAHSSILPLTLDTVNSFSICSKNVSILGSWRWNTWHKISV